MPRNAVVVVFLVVVVAGGGTGVAVCGVRSGVSVRGVVERAGLPFDVVVVMCFE